MISRNAMQSRWFRNLYAKLLLLLTWKRMKSEDTRRENLLNIFAIARAKIRKSIESWGWIIGTVNNHQNKNSTMNLLGGNYEHLMCSLLLFNYKAYKEERWSIELNLFPAKKAMDHIRIRKSQQKGWWTK